MKFLQRSVNNKRGCESTSRDKAERPGADRHVNQGRGYFKAYGVTNGWKHLKDPVRRERENSH